MERPKTLPEFCKQAATDWHNIRVTLSQAEQEETFGDEEACPELQMSYEKALKKVGVSWPSRLYVMNKKTQEKYEDSPAISHTQGTWIHPQFAEKKEEEKNKIFDYHAYNQGHKILWKKILVPNGTYYGGLTTWFVTSLRLISKRPTIPALIAWCAAGICTTLGDQLKYGGNGTIKKHWNNYLITWDRKAHQWAQ